MYIVVVVDVGWRGRGRVWNEAEPEDGIELLGHRDGDVEAVGQRQHLLDLLHAGINAAAVDDRDEAVDLVLVALWDIEEHDVVRGLHQASEVRADGRQDKLVSVDGLPVPAPDGDVGVEAGLEALPGLGDHVLVQILRVNPQHRHTDNTL